MGSFNWPSVGGNGVAIYANLASFPLASTVPNGTLSVAADTNILYESNGTAWQVIAGPGTVLSLGAFGSTPNADGLSLSSNVLTLQPADGTHPGGVSTATQTFAGDKTFSGTIGASNLSGTNTGDVTLGTANGLSLSSQVLSLGTASTSTTGALTSTDWNTFNGKQAALIFTSPLDNTSSTVSLRGATGTAFVGSGGTGATTLSYTSLNTNSTLVSRDANGNSYFVNVNGASAATSGSGTVTMNAGSAQIQKVTGSATVTFVLPDATTLINGNTYQFNNNSSNITTIQNASAGAITTVPSGGFAQLICTDNSTTAGVWDYHFTTPPNTQWGTAALTLGTGTTLSLQGSSTGVITVQTQAAAGTYNFNMPTTAGTLGQLLTSAGGSSSPMTWTTNTGFTTPTTGSSFGNVTASGSLTGIDVTAIGVGAGAGDTSGHDNVFLGYNSGNAATTANFATVIGSQAVGTGIMTGANNTVIGYQAGKALTSGADNTFIGYQAGVGATGASNVVAVGSGAAASGSFSGSHSVFIGYAAGGGATSGTYSIGIGDSALHSSDSGAENIAIGGSAGYAISSGHDNILFGYGAGQNISTGAFTIAIGTNSMQSISTTTAGTISIGHGADTGNFANSIALTPGDTTSATVSCTAAHQFALGDTRADSYISAIYLGKGAVGGTTGQALTMALSPVVSGTSNTAGGNFTIQPGNGTGTGGSGSLIFQTAPVAGSSTSPNTMQTVMTIQPAGTINMPLLTTAGALVNDSSGNVTSAGGTSGYVLTSNGSSSAPTFQAAGTGTVTSVQVAGANGLSFSGGPITGSGTITASLKAPTVQKFTSAGIQTGWLFSVTGWTGTIAIGDTYTNNGHTYTAQIAQTNGGSGFTLFMSGTSSTTSSGTDTLTKGSSASGPATITFNGTLNVPTATYTTPTSPSPLYIKVRMVGPGGGGAGSGTSGGSSSGNSGNDAHFGLLIAGTGQGGTYNGSGGAGGTFTITLGAGWTDTGASMTGNGGQGFSGGNSSGNIFAGGTGGPGVFGGGGVGTGYAGAGTNATANSGSGGGGGGTNNVNSSVPGSGGGAGAYVEAIMTASIPATIPYALGNGGGGGANGASGLAGGNGALGKILVEEYYQ